MPTCPFSYAKDTASTQRMETIYCLHPIRQAVDGYNEDGGKRNEHGYMDMEQEAAQSRCVAGFSSAAAAPANGVRVF